MEYKKLEKPIYWMGFTKGQFTKRKFIEYQAAFPRYLRTDDGEVRFFSKAMESKMDKICFVGSFSKYSYQQFTKQDEIEFLREIVKYNNRRVGQIQRKIDGVNRETNKIIDIIKEKENAR